MRRMMGLGTSSRYFMTDDWTFSWSMNDIDGAEYMGSFTFFPMTAALLSHAASKEEAIFSNAVMSSGETAQ